MLSRINPKNVCFPDTSKVLLFGTADPVLWAGRHLILLYPLLPIT